jgi:putative glutamine amidotransferase
VARRPRIVVTCSRRAAGPGADNPARQRPPRPEVYLLEAYLDAVVAGGGLPLLVAPVDGEHEQLVEQALELADGVVISGGPVDLLPGHYGQEPRVPFTSVDEPRARLELALARACVEREIPLLGICGGLQVLAVAVGGTLVQDLEREWREPLEHQQPTPPSQAWHAVDLEPGLVRCAYGRGRIEVNSTHRQAIDGPGALQVTGRAPDGVVEVAELRGHPWCLGVQWHPEALDGSLYPELCAAAARFRALRR